MTSTLEERQAIRDAFHRLMAGHNTEADVRRIMETPEGYDPSLWQALAEMGLTGLLISPDHGGSGLGPVELEYVMEEAGAALLCAPFLSSCVMAATLLECAGDGAAKARLLPGIASGKRIATVALTGKKGSWTEDGVDVTAKGSGETATLNGTASYVIHGQIADTLLVAAKTENGIAVFEVEKGTGGLDVKPLSTFDRTLRLAEITFKNVKARQLAGTGWSEIAAMIDVALIALAGEQAGGAQHMLDMAVNYAKERVQFGRMIGSFQAVKHMAADLLLETESATSAARHAANSLAEGSAEAGADVALAAFACADAFTTVTATAIQMHGGIAFTWEHPAHLYFRRARADAQLLGTPAFYRERYLTELGA